MKKQQKYTSVLVLRETSEKLTKLKHFLELESIDAVINSLVEISKDKSHLVKKIKGGELEHDKRKDRGIEPVAS